LNPSATDQSQPTAAIETHGCKLNIADSAELAAQLMSAGYRLVGEDGPADVYIVNTCTVTHVADRKARKALRGARERNPTATVVATGCFAQRSPVALGKIPGVDIVAGNTAKPDLVQRIVEGGGRMAERPAAHPMTIAPRAFRTRATIKIQEGCDQVCAYCIVPRVRGRERSIPAGDIVSRISSHVAEGYMEIVLTGTQLGSYGFDLEGMDLKGLVRRILSECAMPRLRMSSLQAQEIGPDILALWSDSRLAPHFHIPLQSGSDAVLARMRRRYTASRYLEAVGLVRRSVPGVSITTDVIVGFPGETDADFEATFSLCERVGFAGIHVFPYSQRPGTSATHYVDQLDDGVKRERMARLLELAGRSAAEYRDGLFGAVRQVLWENPRLVNGEQHWAGLTDNYVRVIAPSPQDLGNRITGARLLRDSRDGVVAEVMG